MAPAVRQAGELRSAPVESLRALAALGVLVGHVYGAESGYAPTVFATWAHRAVLGGGFGVFLFFTLSGYLLYLPFARRTFGGARPVGLARYARNRALRILPLYYVVVTTYLAVFHAPRFDWPVFLLFGENFSRRTVARIDGPVWSLVVELMFYVMLPVLAAALARASGRSLRRAGAWLVVLGVAAAAVRWALFVRLAHPGPLAQYNLPVTFYFFVPGMLLALVKVATERAAARPWPGLVGSSWVWLALSAAGWAIVFDHYRWDVLLGPASFLLVGACVLPLRRSVPVAALGWRPLAVLGTASYSLYLWHMPIVDALGRVPLGDFPGHLAVDGVTCVAVALASYRLIEAPFLRLRTSWGDTAARDDVAATAAARPRWRPVQSRTRRVRSEA